MSEMTNEAPDQTPVDAPADQPAVSDEPVQAEPAEDAPVADSAEPVEDADSPETSQPNEPDNVVDSRLSESQRASDLPVAEDGTVDPVAFKEQILSEARQEARFEAQERKAWESLEDKYPELKENANLRKIILSHRVNDVQSGGEGSLVKSAEDVMQEIVGARSAGKTDARTNIKTEKKAGLSRPSAPKSDPDGDIRQQISSGDDNAIQSVLTGWLDQGKI